MRWLHVGIKDLRVTVRDRASLGILIAMPMILIVILSSALGNLAANLGKTPVAIVNLDQGRVGAQVTDPFFTDPKLTELFLARRMIDPIEAKALVAKGDLAGALVIPSDFSRRLDTGRPSKLMLFSDPGRQISSAVFKGVAEALSTRVSAASIAARTSAFYVAPLRVRDPGFVYGVIGKAVQSASDTEALSAVELVESTAARGAELSTLSYYSGAMSVMFLMFGSMFGALSLVRERDHWTLPRMLMTPGTKWEILGGKMFGVFVIGALQFAVLFGFTSALGVKWGDLMAVGLVAFSTVAAATGLAIFIAAVAKTVRAVSGVSQMLIQFMAAVGGSFFPVAQFPAWLQPLHYFSVNGWAIDGILAAMRGANAVDVLPNVGALLVIAVVFFTIGAWRLGWE
ncbi:MAG TPA: ABC transporter permease [Coriobacteriia bacterium]